MVHDLFENDAFVTLAKVLSESPPEVILDVGAHVGSSSERLVEHFATSRIVAFEPVMASFDRLSTKLENHARVETVRLAVGNRNREIEMRINGAADTSSVLAPTGSCVRYHGDKVRQARTERAEMVRLDDWAKLQGAGAIEAMKIDVQGLELEVLRGAEGLLETTVKAVISEAQLSPIYDGAATFAEIDLFLRSRGFVLHQVCRIASSGAEQRTTCCDGLWVRSDVHLAFVERATRAEAASAVMAS